jgi:hypothetical protein
MLCVRISTAGGACGCMTPALLGTIRDQSSRSASEPASSEVVCCDVRLYCTLAVFNRYGDPNYPPVALAV